VTKVVLASGNQGKLKELNQLLAPCNIEAVSQSEFDITPAVENGLSFVENAILKARWAAKHSGLPAIADDSGLEVDYLKGQPGIYSARFSGVDATDEKNNTKLLNLLKGVALERRTARFQCVVVYMRHEDDPTPMIFQGSWEGAIGTELAGDNGFGYDPLFFVPSLNLTSAQLVPEQKNRLSHRGQAMTRLLHQLN
jgi:XTP/dITP diphosphohydrolase|tara:strand:+ start:9150 stop:9737 length:588 start_codon:yes stop_codon:yes gene_type:complete